MSEARPSFATKKQLEERIRDLSSQSDEYVIRADLGLPKGQVITYESMDGTIEVRAAKREDPD